MKVENIAVIVALLTAAQPAAAADQAAQFLGKLFAAACIPNLGEPRKVREWASDRRLEQIQNQAALGAFVGPGDKGAAWAIPAAEGNFALSIRGSTQACAVWAQSASPQEALILFNKLIDGVRRPGIEITVAKDDVAQSPVGDARALVYNMKVPNSRTSFVFTLLTAERAGGAYQASMQAAKAWSPN